MCKQHDEEYKCVAKIEKKKLENEEERRERAMEVESDIAIVPTVRYIMCVLVGHSCVLCCVYSFNI